MLLVSKIVPKPLWEIIEHPGLIRTRCSDFKWHSLNYANFSAPQLPLNWGKRCHTCMCLTVPYANNVSVIRWSCFCSCVFFTHLQWNHQVFFKKKLAVSWIRFSKVVGYSYTATWLHNTPQCSEIQCPAPLQRWKWSSAFKPHYCLLPHP